MSTAPVEDPSAAPGRHRALWLLALALVLSMTTWFSASAVIPQLKLEWGLSRSAGSWLTIAVQVGFVIGALVSSLFNLSDLIPATRLILLGSIGAAGVNLGLVAAAGAATGIPLRFATGFFLAAVYPPALKLMATWFRKGRGSALGILVGAITLGSAAPHLVNGLGGLDWELVIVVTSILTVTGGLIAALFVGEGPFPFPRAVFDPSKARMVFRDRGVMLASLGYFGHMWELYAMWAWFVVFYADSLAASGAAAPRSAAYAAFAVIGVGAFGCWVGGILGDRWGRTQVTSAMMITSGLCAISIGFFFGGSPGIVLAIGLVWGFSVVGDSAQFSTMVTELADQAYVGTALTLQLAAGFTLTVATIWLIPIFVEHFTWRWAFALLAPGPALGTWAMTRLRGSLTPDR